MTGAARIGLFTPGWSGQNTPNGIATAVFQLAMGLHRIGQTPVIVAEHLDGDAPDGIPVVHVPDLEWCWQDRLRGRLGDPDAGHWHRARRIAAGLRQAQETHGVDAFIMEETNGWAGMVQRLVSCPVCITLHGPWTLLQPWVSVEKTKADRQREHRERRALRRATGIIAPSRNVLSGLEKIVPLPGKSKAVLPNSLAAAQSPQPFAAQDAGNILFVGRFDFLKGADTALEAFSLLSETHPQARLTFVGVDKGLRGPDGSVLHAQAALERLPEDLRSRIRYTGPLDWPQIARLRDSHPIALIASRYEVFGYTMLEAMAAGQAIVSTDVGGPGEVLEHERTALLVPPGDAVAMAGALARLLGDPALRARLGASGRDRLLRDFSPEEVARQTVAFVREVLGAGRRR